MNNLMNIDIIEKNIKKYEEIYLKEEEMIFSEITENFSTINPFYNSEHTIKLKNAEEKIISKFKKIIELHENNILVLKNGKESYIKVAKNAEESFRS